MHQQKQMNTFTSFTRALLRDYSSNHRKLSTSSPFPLKTGSEVSVFQVRPQKTEIHRYRLSSLQRTRASGQQGGSNVASPLRPIRVPVTTTVPKFHVYKDGDDAIVLSEDERGNWYEQSRTEMLTGRAKHEYARKIVDSIDDTKYQKILILGCGGASIPHELYHHHRHVDMTVVDNKAEALEIGKYLVCVTMPHFLSGSGCSQNKGTFDKDKTRYHGDEDIDWVLADASEYVRDTPVKYDIIITDIFDVASGEVPDWTRGPCFLHDVREKLTDTGIYIQNIIATDFRDHLCHLSSQFGYVHASSCKAVSRDGDIVKNVVFWCRPDSSPVPGRRERS